MYFLTCSIFGKIRVKKMKIRFGKSKPMVFNKKTYALRLAKHRFSKK